MPYYYNTVHNKVKPDPITRLSEALLTTNLLIDTPQLTTADYRRMFNTDGIFDCGAKSVNSTIADKPLFFTDYRITQLSDETIKRLMGLSPIANNILNVGDVYYLHNGTIEGINLSGIYLKLYKIIDNYRGVDLNSIVVREVIPDDEHGFVDAFEKGGAEHRRKFSMPPSMCKKMGIEFKPGYELWPKHIPLIKVDKQKIKIPEHISANLGEYPCYAADKSIRCMVITLGGIHQFGDALRMPNGNRVLIKDFLNGLRVSSKIDIPGGGGFAYFNRDETIPYKIYTEKSGFCNQYGEIYLTLIFNRKTRGNKGINPKNLENLSINDFVNVSYTKLSKTESDVLNVPEAELLRKLTPRRGGIWPFF